MFKTLKNAWKIEDLRKKMIFTVAIVLLYRLGASLPVPYISSSALSSIMSIYGGSSIFSYLNILSGQAFSRATLFALSVSPYITASIVIQLLTVAIPALERLSKNGEDGREKIKKYTRIVTVILSVITAYGYYAYMRSVGVVINDGWFTGLVIVSCYCAGAALIMWLAEKINENGIGKMTRTRPSIRHMMINAPSTLPNSRIHRDTGLINSSRMFIGSIAGIGSAKLCSHPFTPLARILAACTSTMVITARAAVTVTSFVGGLIPIT